MGGGAVISVSDKVKTSGQLVFGFSYRLLLSKHERPSTIHHRLRVEDLILQSRFGIDTSLYDEDNASPL